jgi:ABC-type microcin C transport system permease subunit YejB
MTKKIGYTVFSLIFFLSSCANTESGCGSVEQCLASFDFEGARKTLENEAFYDIGTKKRDITIAESKYWADQGNIEKALSIIDESWGIDDNSWPESDWQAWRYNIIDKGVSLACEKSNYTQAKVYALKAPDDLNVDGFKIGVSTGKWQDKKGNTYSEQYYCERDGVKPCTEIKTDGPSMRESLLKKISQFEELIK